MSDVLRRRIAIALLLIGVVVAVLPTEDLGSFDDPPTQADHARGATDNRIRNTIPLYRDCHTRRRSRHLSVMAASPTTVGSSIVGYMLGLAMTRASPGRERPSLIVHLFVDCVDTLHRTRPQHRRRQRGILARLCR